MEEQDSPWLSVDVESLHRVMDADQAAVIADPKRAWFLQPFLGRENTVVRAAAELGCEPSAMLYRVRRMHSLGILRVVREERRAGRPVKVYRSVHEGYFVPTEVMRYDDLRHRVATQGRVLVEDLIDSYVAVLGDSKHSGRVFARNRQGQIWASDLLPHTNRRGQPAYFGDLRAYLTRAEAEQVRDLLHDALERSLDAPAERADDEDRPERYLFVGAILPA